MTFSFYFETRIIGFYEPLIENELKIRTQLSPIYYPWPLNLKMDKLKTRLRLYSYCMPAAL